VDKKKFFVPCPGEKLYELINIPGFKLFVFGRGEDE